MSRKDIEVVVDNSEPSKQKIEQVVADALRPFIGQPFEDITALEIELEINDIITTHLMDDFLVQKSDELKSCIALFGETDEGEPCVQGFLIHAEQNSVDPSCITINFEKIAEDLL